MAVLDAIKPKSKPGEPIPDGLEQRINRGRERLQTLAVYRDEAWEFYRGNHYAYVDDRGKLGFRPTVSSPGGRGKQSHRVRRARNLIFDVVLRERSAATQRIPSYQVLPSTSDPQDVSAARLSEKVLLYGHLRWDIRRVMQEMVTHAVVAGEAFAWVYFDSNVGPFSTFPGEDGESETVGRGEVKVRIYGANQCFWEPGLRFEESPWHVIEYAQSPEQVYRMPGYLEGKLQPDASTRSMSQRGRGANQPPQENLVLVSTYLELPSSENPEGRWVTMANGRQIIEERPYPNDGETPCLRKLSYAPDPDWDRDIGLVPMMLDGQRDFNMANNKADEWMIHCLVPRLIAQPGMLGKQRWTDEPGKVYEVPRPNEFVKVVETPPVPPELFTIADRATSDMDRLAARTDVSGMDSGKQVQAALESDGARRQSFLADVAQTYADIGRDSLVQVQEHYTEDRLIQIKGSFGWESVPDFRGSQLNNQIDVRVFPDSIEPLTRQAQEAKIMAFAERGWIAPDQAMTAISTGNVGAALRSQEYDEARAAQIIQRIKSDTFWEMPPRPVLPNEAPGWEVEPVLGPPEPVIDPQTGQPALDPTTGQPVMGEPPVIEPGIPETTMPGWMPRPFDNVKVHLSLFADWMKTVEYDSLPPEQMQAANAYYAALLDIESRQAQREAELQTQMAEAQGMSNAAKPQSVKPTPDQAAEAFGPEAGSPETL